MTLSVTHATAADGSFSPEGQAAWDEEHTVTGDLAFADLADTPTTLAGYGITDAFDGSYASLSGIPATFTPSAHGHVIGDVTGLQTALDAKADSTTGV